MNFLTDPSVLFSTWMKGLKRMNIDFMLFQWINHMAGRNVWVDHMMVFYIEYGPLLFGMILLWLWFSKRENTENKRRMVLLAAATVLIALGINQIIGTFYFHERPFAAHAVTLLVHRSTDPSFPSDHSTGAFALALAMLWQNRKLGRVMIGMAILMAFSRVFVGVHYTFDVLGGSLTALLGMTIIRSQHRRLEPAIQWILQMWNKVEGIVLHNMHLLPG